MKRSKCTYGDRCDRAASFICRIEGADPCPMCGAHAVDMREIYGAEIERTNGWEGDLELLSVHVPNDAATWTLRGAGGMIATIRIDLVDCHATVTFNSTRYRYAAAEAARFVAMLHDTIGDLEQAHADNPKEDPAPVLDVDTYHAGPNARGSRVEITGGPDLVILIGAYFADTDGDPSSSVDLPFTLRGALADASRADEGAALDLSYDPDEDRTP